MQNEYKSGTESSKNQIVLATEKCKECGSLNLIEDKKQGDLICTECGLVIDGHLIDFTSEWRNFFDDTRSQDPNRVGSPIHKLLENNPGTIISKGLKGSNFMNEKLIRIQNQSNFHRTDRYLNRVFKKIRFFMENGFLSTGVKNKVEELFKLYFDHLTLKTNGSRTKACLRKNDTISIIAACFFIVLKNQGKPRTFKEIELVTKIPKKTIGNKVRAIERSLGVLNISRTRNTSNFIPRFCDKLGLPSYTYTWAEDVAKIIREKPGIYGRTYISIAAISIYIITQLPIFSINKSLKEVSDITGVAESTLRETYKAIYPYRDEISKNLNKKNNPIGFPESVSFNLISF